MTKAPARKDVHGVFRRELFEYQERKLFGEPISIRPPSPWWCLGPCALLIAWMAAFSSLRHRPCVRAQLVPGEEGAVVLSIVDDGRAVSTIHVGDRVALARADGGAAYGLEVMSLRVERCGASARCLEVGGALRRPDDDGPASLRRPTWVELALPSRPLLSSWTK